MYSFTGVDLNLGHTLDCGQVFRWERDHVGEDAGKDAGEGDWWIGVVNGDVVRAGNDIESGTVLVDSSLPREFVASYFRLDDDLPHILGSIDKDCYISEAIKKYRGLRLIRQEPWECMISYMLATASSIPTIKKRISLLSRMFGEGIGGDIGEGYYSFPDAASLANADESDMCECKLGFRAGRIQRAAQQVADGEFCFDELFEMDYPGARVRLMEIEGIGEKVADCILLFSIDKMESFPVDTHVRQVVEKYYSGDEYFGGGGGGGVSVKISNHKMGEWGRRYFGGYCGYAQEYLYYCWRMRG